MKVIPLVSNDKSDGFGVAMIIMLEKDRNIVITNCVALRSINNSTSVDRRLADLSARAVRGEDLLSLACWDCGFESRLGA